MLSRLRSIATILMILMSVFLAASQVAAQTAPPATLTDKQQRVLDYMLNDWNKQMRITGIELAMQNVGGQYSPDDRYAIGVFLRNNPRLHRTLRTFGWETATLTPTEKLIARIVSRAERENQPPPTREELARILEVSPDAEKLKIAYPVVVGNDDVEKGFGGILGFPTTFLVNRKGQIYKKYTGTYPEKQTQIEADIQKLLAEKGQEAR